MRFTAIPYIPGLLLLEPDAEIDGLRWLSRDRMSAKVATVHSTHSELGTLKVGKSRRVFFGDAGDVFLGEARAKSYTLPSSVKTIRLWSVDFVVGRGAPRCAAIVATFGRAKTVQLEKRARFSSDSELVYVCGEGDFPKEEEAARASTLEKALKQAGILTVSTRFGEGGFVAYEGQSQNGSPSCLLLSLGLVELMEDVYRLGPRLPVELRLSKFCLE